jgi:hypothetical protein
VRRQVVAISDDESRTWIRIRIWICIH